MFRWTAVEDDIQVSSDTSPSIRKKIIFPYSFSGETLHIYILNINKIPTFERYFTRRTAVNILGAMSSNPIKIKSGHADPLWSLIKGERTQIIFKHVRNNKRV